MSRKIEIATEGHLRPTNPSAVSSTSGEGEREGGAVYAFSPRRKTRRKTIVTSDVSRLTGQGVHSESALGSPSPPILHLPLLQTNFSTSIEYSVNGEVSSKGPTSPKRTSGRKSPTKSHLTNILVGQNGFSDAIKSHGIPRTLTLPTHLTDTLMKMKISTDHTSVESLTQDLSKNKSKAKDDKQDGMEVDDAPTEGGAIAAGLVGNITSGRKQKSRKRARSLPPRPVITHQDDEECDADDEGGGPDAGNDEGGLMSPVVTIPTTRRGRLAVGEEDEMQGMTMTGAAAVGALRRSARRLTVGSPGVQRTLAERLGVMMSPVEESMPRKRARTRDGREGSSALGEEDDGRSRKKTRKW
ncbi:hypothetical protein FRC20_011468 [Serendipita sp. 405]|nr:hypothetical protein FRC16_002105 [Serendipita sp. 398]KAG8870673.1 hypothetical protein FRC20_011468 [Serendipita sp. 405]